MNCITIIGRRLGTALCLLVIGATATVADDLPWSLGGRVVVTAVSDGDTIRSGQLRIRLHGIDAPERQQHCTTPEGARWACGNAARDALKTLVASVAALDCQITDVDRYGRLIMRCFAGEIDVGARLVRTGMALAYRRYADDYIADEEAARAARLGLWAGQFDAPWDWRRSQQR
jgi:endonuclease YncB( thermonuclease family)